MIENIENVELQFLTLDDYKELKEVMIEAYSSMSDSYWKEAQIESLIDKFPEGQVVIKINNELAGCALSIILDYKAFDEKHTYKEITGAYSFDTPTTMMATFCMALMFSSNLNTADCASDEDCMTTGKNSVRN